MPLELMDYSRIVSKRLPYCSSANGIDSQMVVLAIDEFEELEECQIPKTAIFIIIR